MVLLLCEQNCVSHILPGLQDGAEALPGTRVDRVAHPDPAHTARGSLATAASHRAFWKGSSSSLLLPGQLHPGALLSAEPLLHVALAVQRDL